MLQRIACLATLSVLGVSSCAGAPHGADGAASEENVWVEDDGAPRRAIRRDVPRTKAIRRAFEAGTRNATGSPGANYWQLETDFTIRARIDSETQTITGEESIVIHNQSPDELEEIWLRLDHNIFLPRVPRGSSVPAETTEGMVVTRIAYQGEEIDLTRRRRGDGLASVRGLDQTLAAITLVEPIPPRTKVVLEIDWYTKLPGGDGGRGHRMTQRWGDELFQPTQWFPRLAKYDDLRGWDSNVYLGPAEFYNNFGRFDVKLDVPANWLVSATGVLQNPEEVLTEAARERLARVLTTDEELMIVTEEETEAGDSTLDGDRLVWHFVADKVNDFAWATARDYVWRATRAIIPGQGAVPVHMFYLPRREARFEQAGSISRHALEFYSDLWAPYPFPQLTLQDGPSSGMEYPMVINSNQGAADHEVAHQWWPMMVGTNETWYGWMDEGLNMYMNILSDAHRQRQIPTLDGQGQSYGRISGEEWEPPMMWSANYGGPYYGFQTYMKTPMMLSMLGGVVGDERLQMVIADYTEEWSFKHPSPWDFVNFVSSELGEDLGWFWYYWLFTTEAVDGSIQDVTTQGDTTVVTVHQAGQMPSPIVLQIEFESEFEADFEVREAAGASTMSNAVFREDGTALVTWPVDVWFDGDTSFAALLDFGGRAIKKVTLDPQRRFPDTDPSDNTWPR